MAKNNKTSTFYIDGKQAGQTLADLRKRSRELNNEVNQLTPGTESYRKKVAELGSVKGQLNAHQQEVRKISGAYSEVKNSMGGMKTLIGGFLGAGLIQKGVQGVISVFTGWINKNKELEKSLSSLQSLTNASDEDMKFYKATAIEMGKSTTQSANQVVDAMKLVGSAKPELLANRQALADVTRETITLAEAAEMEMGPAAQALTGILNQFNKTADESPRVINALAAGSQAGAADIQSLSDTMDKAGAVMDGYNVSIEEGIALAETMAEKNIKGSEAGTQLRNVLLKMQAVEGLPQTALDALEQYGVNTAIVADETIPLNERLKEMSKISGDATAMMRVFGEGNIVAGKAILGNIGAFEKYTAAVTDTNTAYDQARMNTDNLDGDLKSLSSAWEGLNLSVEGSNGVLRYFVQTGTDTLNWVTDTITAFKNWDTTAMETSMLKLGRTAMNIVDPFNLWSKGIRKIIDDKIRLNELTSTVIDMISDESRNVTILTKSLQRNNKELADANTTEERSAEIKEENAKMIDQLKEKYPELTKDIDLQSASYEELDRLQKQATDSILEQAIAEVKAAEQKRILNEIIAETIAQQKLLNEEQGLSDFEQSVIDTLGKGSKASQERLDELKTQLEQVPSTMKDVEGQVKGLNLSFAEDFVITGEIVDETKTKLKQLEDSIASGNIKTNMFIEGTIKGYKQLITEGEKTIADLQKQTEEQEAKENQEARIEKIKAASIEAAKVRKKEHDDALKELEKLKESEIKLQQEQIERQLLASAEGITRDLMQAEFALETKYAKEIEIAERLAQRKDEIGAQARDKIANLELLKAVELGEKKAEIEEKYRLENEAKEKEARLRMRDIAYSIDDATIKTKISLNKLAYDELGEYELEKKRALDAELNQLMIDQAQKEHDFKMVTLMLDHDAKLVSDEEFKVQMEEAEAEHLLRISEMKKAAADRDAQAQEDAAVNALTAIGQAFELVNQIQKLVHQNRMNEITDERDRATDALDERLEKGLITEEQYQREKEEIDATFAEKEKQAKIKQFEAEKKAAIIRATIETAIATIKAGNPIMMAITAALGAVQIALIASQPTPQFKKGGYNVTGADDGITYNATYLGKHKGGMLPSTPVVLASEAGPEYFVSNPMLHNPEVIDHVRAIENIRLRQFAEGGPTDTIPESTTQTPTTTGEADMVMVQMLNFMEINASLLSELLQVLPNLEVAIGDEKVDQLRKRMEQLETIRPRS